MGFMGFWKDWELEKFGLFLGLGYLVMEYFKVEVYGTFFGNFFGLIMIFDRLPTVYSIF